MQLNAKLEGNKTEKQQKEAIKRFLAAFGFANLDVASDLKLSNAAAVSNAVGLPRGRGAVADADAIQWPDLYDINVE